MPAFNQFNAFAEHLAEKVHDLQNDTLKIMLSNVAPVATNVLKADLTEIGAGNGYTAGGTQASVSSSAQASGIYKLVLGDVVFTAVGGSFGPFRYASLYNDTPSSPLDPLIGWWDYGTSQTLQEGETFTVDFDPTTGALQLT